MTAINRDNRDHEERALFAANNCADTTTHSGRLISVTPSLLLTTCAHGQEYAHLLAADTKVTKNGKPCNKGDLRAGISVLVTQRVRNAGVATLIEMLGEDADLARLD